MTVVYLMGAGRSGTTAFASLLGAEPGIVAAGELNQLPQHLDEDLLCGCGSRLAACPFWSDQFEAFERVFTPEYRRSAELLERHRAVPTHLLGGSRSIPDHAAYRQANLTAFRALSGAEGRLVVDSSKYVGRALALSSISELDVRFLYIVRHPRGVADSFGKAVQTSRNLFRALLYYIAVNLAAEIASRTVLRGRTLKLRFEDLLEHPARELAKVEQFIGKDLPQSTALAESGTSFGMGHFVGGNRIRSSERITWRRTPEWRNRTLIIRVMIWVLTLPLNLLNRYGP